MYLNVNTSYKGVMKSYIDNEVKRFNVLFSEIDSAYHDVAVKLGLSDSMLNILYAVCNKGDRCLLNDIVHVLGMSKQTVNSALRKMEDEGILYLEKFDNKKKIICLTDKGNQIIEDKIMPILKIESEIYDSWGKEYRDIYFSLTENYLKLFKEKIKDI